MDDRPRPRLMLVLSENWTLIPPRDLPALVAAAREAEAAGADGVMLSEHVVLGAGADAAGVPANPREYALPGNQDPATPWPSPLPVLAAISAATIRLRLVAGAVIAPLRHPLLLAKELATIDLLSRGRLVVLPTVSWHRAEYAALGVAFHRRGELLDEHLAVWRRAWSGSPVSFDGRWYRFTDVWVEPGPWRPGGPVLWFGGSTVHRRLVERVVRYGQGFNPLGRPAAGELERLHGALRTAGRDPAEVELVGGIRGRFRAADGLADLDEALAAVPAQLAAGYTTICAKPAQFIADPGQLGQFCRRVVARLDEVAGRP